MVHAIPALRLLAAAALLASLCACDTGAVAPVPTAVPLQTVAPASSSRTITPGPPAIQIDAITGRSTDQTGPGAYRYRVEVPQLAGLPPGSQAIDTLIRSRLQAQVDAFLDLARGAQGVQGGDPLSELACTSKTVRVTARLVVLRVDCSEYEAGNAHGVSASLTFNCDVAGGRILALQDLFSAGAGYLDVLSTAARTQLRTTLGSTDADTLAAGTAPQVDNFKAFLLARGGLVVVFAQYQVAAGSAGEPEVTVSYDALQRYFASSTNPLLTG